LCTLSFHSWHTYAITLNGVGAGLQREPAVTLKIHHVLLRAAKASFQLLIQCWIFVVITGILSSDVHNMLFGIVTQAPPLPVSTLTYLRSHSFHHPLPSTLHSKEPFLSDSHEHHAQTPTSFSKSTSQHFGPSPKGASIQQSVKTTNSSFALSGARTPDLLGQFSGESQKLENASHGARTRDLVDHISAKAQIGLNSPNSSEFGANSTDFMVFGHNFSIFAYFHVVSPHLANYGQHIADLAKFSQIWTKFHRISAFLRNFQNFPSFHNSFVHFAYGPHSGPLSLPSLAHEEGPIHFHTAFHQRPAGSGLGAAQSTTPAWWALPTSCTTASPRSGGALGQFDPVAAALQTTDPFNSTSKMKNSARLIFSVRQKLKIAFV
jgi:hypothetical protein